MTMNDKLIYIFYKPSAVLTNIKSSYPTIKKSMDNFLKEIFFQFFFLIIVFSNKHFGSKLLQGFYIQSLINRDQSGPLD